MWFRGICALVLSISIIALSAAGSFAGEKPSTLRLVEILKAKGVISDSDYADLMKPASPADDQALNRRLIRVLYEKGVLDEASFIELAGMTGMEGIPAQAEAGNEAAAPVPAGSEPVKHAEPSGSPADMSARQAIPAVDKGLTAVEQGVARLGRDEVTMKINFFLQTGWLNDDAGFSSGNPPTGDYSTTAGNQFFLRRARLYLSGKVLDNMGYKFSIDPTASTLLKDAYLYLDYIPYARVTLGQFKVPFGNEGPLALAELPVANRSMITNLVHYPTLRDRGAMLSGKYNYRGGDNPLMVSYEVAAVNGNGDNKADDNDAKDVSVRVLFNPMLPCLTLGGSYYAGKSFSGGMDRHKERWGAEFVWKPIHVKGLKFMGEFVAANQYYPTYVSRNINVTTGLPALGRHVRSDGWYVLGAYSVSGLDGSLRFLNGLEPVFRYEFMDEDMYVSDNERTKTTIGLNYYIAKDTRLLLNYEIVHADGKLKLQSLEKIDTISHNVLTTMLQMKF